MLRQVTTGDGWYDMIYDAATAPPLCTQITFSLTEPWSLSEFCYLKCAPQGPHPPTPTAQGGAYSWRVFSRAA